ncbi:MAG: hypothetical protein E7299_08830 [Lachnospiraceae bacterium]|nr:hypothetical protein [Lachnospiraceae bacterium]
MKIGTDSYLQQTQNYAAYSKQAKAAEETKTEAASTGVTVEFSSEGKEAAKTATDTVKVTRAEEIANETGKMTKSQRASLAQQLKADQENRKSQLISMVESMLSGQTTRYAQANNIWDILRTGNFTVDAATKAQAQADIAEDGYYGVKQTSERMFKFAMSLAGDDVDKMKEMQEAMQKGFKQAEKTWGGELPEISKKTMDAANKLFEDYFASREKAAEEPATNQKVEDIVF